MRWISLSVNGEMEIKGVLRCPVCRKLTNDLIYCPKDFTEEQAEWIKTIWKCEPYEEFIVCEDCMTGYDGTTPRGDADKWLEYKIAWYKRRSHLSLVVDNSKDIKHRVK